MAFVKRHTRSSHKLVASLLLALLPVMAISAFGQSSQNQSQSQGQSPKSQGAQDIPDAPSAVQPPQPKFTPPPNLPPVPDQNAGADSSTSASQPGQQEKPAPPPMPPIETIAPGSMPEAGAQTAGPRNQINPSEDLYKISVTTNFVQIPVMVKDTQGRLVYGLLHTDFEVLENGKAQKLTYFSTDPWQLSVAIILDLGMADVTVQKVNQTYGSLVGAFSPYDEFALYTYSSTVSQVTDFTRRPERLTAALDQMKLVRGHENGPPILGGPLASGPTVNGMPVGGGPAPVNTPSKEAHVLNDAILRAALDLNKRDRTRRKVILVISDGRERGSQASYKDVLKLLETYGIQVKAVVLDSGALPVFKQVEKIHHVFNQGYADILPKYTNATGGGQVLTELTRNAIEDAYGQITSEARNQYTLGYSPKAIATAAAYRELEVRVMGHGRDLSIYTKAGYYPTPTAH